ncbi:hypothetical protein PGB90_006884 [Kerria lacca]
MEKKGKPSWVGTERENHSFHERRNQKRKNDQTKPLLKRRGGMFSQDRKP